MLAISNPHPTQKSNKKFLLVFNLNNYPDGNGDVGNLIEVSDYIISKLGGLKKVKAHFVIGGGDRDGAKVRFVNGSHFKHNEKNIYIYNGFIATKSFQRQGEFEASRFLDYIKSNIFLKNAYLNADGVYNIATPFFIDYSATLWNKILKPGIIPINITEHGAKSYEPYYRVTIKVEQHFVTGFEKIYSGLMVSDQAYNRLGALLSIHDKSYLKKLGFDKLPTIREAETFLKNTLIVPVYLGRFQICLLQPLIFLIQNSILSEKFSNIYFHINAYDKALFDRCAKVYNEYDYFIDKKKFIIGHFFEDPEDFKRVFQTSSKVGIAIVSGDKTLELAISTGVMPLCVPPTWKTDVINSFIKFIYPPYDNENFFPDEEIFDQPLTTQFAKLLYYLNYATLLKGEDYFDHLKNLLLYCQLLRPKLIDNWVTEIRDKLLEKSFFKIIDQEIIAKIVSDKSISELDNSKSRSL